MSSTCVSSPSSDPPGGGGGGTHNIFVWRCAARSSKPLPYISDQNIRFGILSIDLRLTGLRDAPNDVGVFFFAINVYGNTRYSKNGIPDQTDGMRLRPGLPSGFAGDYVCDGHKYCPGHTSYYTMVLPQCVLVLPGPKSYLRTFLFIRKFPESHPRLFVKNRSISTDRELL